MNELESQVKELIKASLFNRISGKGQVDPLLTADALVDRWLTDIMAIAYNNHDLNAAAIDVYEIQKQLVGITLPYILLEDIRGHVHLSDCRFPDEIEAFKKYVDLRNTESSEIVLRGVKKELSMVQKGDFSLM